MDGKSITRKLVGDDEERAVSPVIGVILMVAITVILAAVIAAFVLDLGDTSAGAQAGYTVDVDGDDLDVTISNVDRIDTFGVTCGDHPAEDVLDGSEGDRETDPSVGDTVTADDGCNGDRDELTVYGEYDGQETILN